jgi:hypothetical protein
MTNAEVINERLTLTDWEIESFRRPGTYMAWLSDAREVEIEVNPVDSLYGKVMDVQITVISGEPSDISIDELDLPVNLQCNIMQYLFRQRLQQHIRDLADGLLGDERKVEATISAATIIRDESDTGSIWACIEQLARAGVDAQSVARLEKLHFLWAQLELRTINTVLS